MVDRASLGREATGGLSCCFGPEFDRPCIRGSLFGSERYMIDPRADSMSRRAVGAVVSDLRTLLPDQDQLDARDQRLGVFDRRRQHCGRDHHDPVPAHCADGAYRVWSVVSCPVLSSSDMRRLKREGETKEQKNKFIRPPFPRPQPATCNMQHGERDVSFFVWDDQMAPVPSV